MSYEDDIEINNEIRGGMPVLRGTRIGVYEVASHAAVEPLEKVLETFPRLTPERVENAIKFAKAHPLRKVKTTSGLPKGARLISSRKVDLKSL